MAKRLHYTTKSHDKGAWMHKVKSHAMRPLPEMLEHEIANEKIRLLNMPESEQTEETEDRLADILDWEEGNYHG